MGKRARFATALAGAIVITVAVAWATLAAIDALALDRPAAFFAFGIGTVVWAFALHRLGTALNRNARS
jgi:hypothetical protein